MLNNGIEIGQLVRHIENRTVHTVLGVDFSNPYGFPDGYSSISYRDVITKEETFMEHQQFVSNFEYFTPPKIVIGSLYKHNNTGDIIRLSSVLAVPVDEDTVVMAAFFTNKLKCGDSEDCISLELFETLYELHSDLSPQEDTSA